MKRFLGLVLVIGLAVLLTSCGGHFGPTLNISASLQQGQEIAQAANPVIQADINNAINSGGVVDPGAIANDVAKLANVKTVSVNSTGDALVVTKADGTHLTILLYGMDDTRVFDPNTPGTQSLAPDGVVRASPSGAVPQTRVAPTDAPKGKKALILAPFQSQFGTDLSSITSHLTNAGFTVDTYTNQAADISKFRGDFLDQYAVIYLQTHGTITGWTLGTLASNVDATLLATGTQATYSAIASLPSDEQKLLAEFTVAYDGKDYFAISPQWLQSTTTSSFPHTYVFANACNSLRYSSGNRSMSQAFLDLGAGGYSGYTDEQAVVLANDIGTTLMADLTAKDYLARATKAVHSDLSLQAEAFFLRVATAFTGKPAGWQATVGLLVYKRRTAEPYYVVPPFGPAVDYPVGSDPYSVATGDLNGDGHPDIVSSNQNGDSVSVLLGHGDGSFDGAITYSDGYNPEWAAVGDLNNDGKPDVVIADGSWASVSVLLGKGDGSFQPQTLYAVGNVPYFVAVADLNNDGKPDVVAANGIDDTVSVLLGNGDGTFKAETTYPAGPKPESVAVGDLNGDGKPDLLIADGNQNIVSVLLGNGDGTFGSPVTYAAGFDPSSVAIGDLNGDGKLDAVTANPGNGTISVLLGNGDGSFQAPTEYDDPYAPAAIAIADIDGDGSPDILAADDTGPPGEVSLLINNGTGGFLPETIYNVGLDPRSLAVADLNGDGRPDIITGNSNDNTVSVLLQQ